MRTATACVLCGCLFAVAASGAEPTAQDVWRETGVRSGLIVQLGCGEGKLITSLADRDGVLVQGLDTDSANVAAARANILSAGCAKNASADVFDGQRLPYIDNLVNLVIAEDLGHVPMQEVMRVLCPGGKAHIGRGGVWTTLAKARPGNIDDWTHFLHEPAGTSVSKDQIAGDAQGLQWTGGPFWTRSHEHTSSMQAMVSAAGRIFYVMDEGPIESIQLPSNFMLTARDAFNGVVLWKKPVPHWFNALFPLKSGPGWMSRRLVAEADRVYVAPGTGHDLQCLDAATGKVVRQYEETATTFELIVSDGVVFASVDPDLPPCDYNQEDPNCWKERDRASSRWGWNRDQGAHWLKAIEAASGRLLWARQMPVAPMTLTADSRRVCFYDGSRVVALDRQTGETQWATDVVDMPLIPTGYSGPRLILLPDRVVFSPRGRIITLDAANGSVLWSVDGKPKSGHFSLEDLYVIGDKVWVLGRGNAGAFVTYSLKDGQKLAEYRNPIRSFYIHQRCYPGRATERLLLPPMMGLMVYDMAQDTWTNNHWVRGACFYGIMPANGMIYTPPTSCACYYQSKINGFDAVVPRPQPSDAPAPEQRRVKGPAFGKVEGPTVHRSDEWPVFRHDNTRSGYVRTDVPARVQPAWQADLGSKLTQPVVAEGKVLVSDIDAHVLHALDAETGEQLWRFVTGGRVDSPPTLYRGLALFGCRDGWVYAVRLDDGQLAWRFRAAPNDRKLVAYGQLESVWPLYGSVLVENGVLYCVAGRCMFLDGGLRMVMLKPETGELIAENVMDRHVPGSDRQLDELLMGKHMPVALPDILSSDGRYVYMKSQTFTLNGKRVRVQPLRPDMQYDEEVHLFSPISFLDDSWHQRTYWLYGRAAGEGWAEFQLPPKRVPYGRIMCLDEDHAFAFGRDPELLCNTSVSEYRLYSASKIPSRKVGVRKLEGQWVKGRYPAGDGLASASVDWKQLSQQPPEKLSALDYQWIEEEPEILAKAMVLANDRLFVAGPRDVVDEKQMWGRSNEPRFREKMAEQAAWLDGQYGGLLQVFSKQNGSKLSELELDYLPVFDGLVAASGRLYMATKSGKLVCFEGK